MTPDTLSRSAEPGHAMVPTLDVAWRGARIPHPQRWPLTSRGRLKPRVAGEPRVGADGPRVRRRRDDAEPAGDDGTLTAAGCDPWRVNGDQPETDTGALQVPRQQSRQHGLVDAYPRCPTCGRPVRMRVLVIDLSDGTCAVDAERLRLALGIHLRRCDGR